MCAGRVRPGTPRRTRGTAAPLASRVVQGDDPRRSLGRLGERLAADHYERLGCEVLERNARMRGGELDLVVRAGRTLVFCEVKTRRAGARAEAQLGRSPLESIGPRKRLQVRRLAIEWLASRRERPAAAEVRFDAIAVLVDARDRLVALEHLEAAF